MATTIVRPVISDDSGGGTDGTILNAAWVTTFCNKIDALFTGAFSVVGPLTVTAIGTHAFTGGAGAVGTNQITLTNAQATGEAQTGFRNVAGSNEFDIFVYNQTSADGGYYGPSKSLLQAQGSGGMSVAAVHASGVIRFYAGGITRRMLLSAAGVLTLDAYTAATFVAGDKYLVVDAAGVIHRSALGPAS